MCAGVNEGEIQMSENPPSPRIAASTPKPRRPYPTVTEVLRLLEAGWRHRATNARFWLELAPAPKLVDELEKRVVESLALRPLKTRWVDADGLPCQPAMVTAKHLELLRQNMRGTLFLLAHQIQRWMSEIDGPRLAKYMPDRMVELTDRATRRLQTKLDQQEPDSEARRRLQAQIQHLQQSRAHYLARRPREPRGAAPKGPSDLAVQMLYRNLSKELKNYWIEVRDTSPRIGLAFIESVLGERLDPRKRQRIRRALWSPAAPKFRSLDLLVRRIVAAYLGCHERTVRTRLASCGKTK